jgi:hypothetical protein
MADTTKPLIVMVGSWGENFRREQCLLQAERLNQLLLADAKVYKTLSSVL